MISSLLFISCNKLTEVKEYYEDGSIERVYTIDEDSIKQGQLVTYFPNGNIKLKSKYRNGEFNDTVYHYRSDINRSIDNLNFFKENGEVFYKEYSENQKVIKQGFFSKNNEKIGKWKYYTNNGNLESIKEFKTINGEQFLNQHWLLISRGDTLDEGKNMKYAFDKIKLKLNDSIRCFFQMETPYFDTSEKIQFSVFIPKDYTKLNFNKDFSNRQFYTEQSQKEILIDGEKNYKVDTTKKGVPTKQILSLKDNKKFANTIDSTKLEQTVLFYWKPKRVGNDTIRGYFEETVIYDANSSKIDIKKTKFKNIYKSSTIYFEQPIEVIK